MIKVTMNNVTHLISPVFAELVDKDGDEMQRRIKDPRFAPQRMKSKNDIADGDHRNKKCEVIEQVNVDDVVGPRDEHQDVADDGDGADGADIK